MDLTLNSKPLILQPKTLLGLRRAKRVRARVLRGVLWVTVAGMPEDIVLEAGERFEFPSNALTLLEAHQSCELTFEPRRNRLSCGWWRRLRDRAWRPLRGWPLGFQ